MSALKNSATKNKLSKLLTTTTMAAAGLVMMNAGQARADNWTDHEAIVGGITIDTSVANTTNISQHDHFVKVRGDGDINAGWTVNVAQPDSSAKYVLYDIESDATQIMGNLNANGEIYIFDQNGIIFGQNSQVNVGALIASTGGIADSDILDNDGKFTFNGVDGDGAIELNGSVTVAEAGLAAFVAPTVVNNGIISAKLGKVALASGSKVTLDLYGDNLVEIAVDDKALNGLVENNGSVIAEGGTVVMAAQTAKQAVDNVINMNGVVDVSSVTVQGGKIILSGGKKGVVKVSGKMDASGKNDGGDIKVTGQSILVSETSLFQSDAFGNGNGGTVNVLADEHADFRGGIFARGGEDGGNGGNAEVSGYQVLGYQGYTDLSAAEGAAGTLLLDPKFAVIHNGVLNNPLGLGYVISAQALANSMRNNNVVVQADDFIDVGTKIGSYNINTGNAILDAVVNAGLNALPDGNIDLSAYDIWNFSYPFHHTGTTNGGLTLDSDTVNFNRTLTMGNGNLSVDANTVNLSARIYEKNGTTELGDARISSNADLVNVLSNSASVQQGVWLADDAGGATVDVAAGTYNESVDIAKSLTLKGVNGGVSGTSASRDLNETILKGVNNYTLYITANDVTVNGLTIAGAISGDGDAVWTQNADDLDFKNNRVLNATFGVISWGGTPVDGVIQNNLIANITQHGIYIGENQYYDVLGNTIGDEDHGVARVGITTENFWLANPTGDVTLIDGNKILASRIGIRNNLSYGTQSGFQISNNTINAGGDIAPRWTGIDVISQQAGVATLFKDNNIEGAGPAAGKQSAGYEFTNMTSTNRAVVDGGTVKNTDVGVWVTDGSFYTGAISDLLVKNVDFGYIAKYGFLVEDTIDPSNAAGLNVNTTGTKVTIGEGNTFTATPYDLAIAGNVTVALEGTAGVSKTLVKAYGASNYAGAPYGTTAPQLYTTNASINTGIGATAAGGAVFVENGLFTENVVVNKALTLRSLNGRNATTIAGIAGVGALGTVVVTDGVNGAKIGDTNAGFTIQGFDNGNPAVENAAVYFQGNHAGATVRGNRIIANGDDALVTEYNLVNSDFVIDGNIFDGQTYVGSSYATSGNQFEVPNRPRQLVALNKGLSNLTFTNNTVTGDAGSNQLVAIESAGSTVTNNFFDGETTSAALRVRGSNAEIASNDLFGNTKGVGIWAQNVNNLTIGGASAEDGNGVTGFINGIVVENGTGTTTVSGNTVYNVDKGINVNNTVGLNVSGNTVYNVDENGIHVVNSASAQIANNLVGTLGFVTGTGIFVDPSPLTTITGNTVNGGQIGIHVLDSNNVTVGGFGAGQANSVTGSGVGIKIQNSDAATVAKNTVNNSGWDAIQIVDGSDNAQVLNNDINGVTGASGIAVMNNSHGAVLDGNTIDDTARLGVYVLNSNGLNIKNNLINNAGLEGSGWYLSGIHLEGANNTTVDNNEVKNARGDGIRIGGAGNQAAQSTTGNIIKNNSVFLISGDAIDVADSAGVQITGNALGTDSLGGGLYLVIGANNVGGKGVNLNNSANASIANNVIFQVAGNGIAVAGSNGTTVSGNYVDAVGANAIHVLNSANARILNNNIGTLSWYFGADSIKGDGIYVENANGTWIKGNTVNETASTAFDVGSGIHVKNSNNVVVGGAGADRNNLTNIAWDGVKITGGDNVSVDNNRIENVARVGIYGGNTTNATIKNNVLINANTGLGGYGAISTDGGSGLKITGNDIDGSVGHGIRVNGATGTNLIDGNFVDGVSQDGILAEGVNKLTVSNNKVGQSSTVGATGINVVNGTHSTTISNNLVDRVGWTGIAANTVAGLKISNNTVGANSSSVGQGIYVNNSVNADVIGNNVYNALQYGLYASLSNGLDVYDNDISGLGSDTGTGVFVQNSSNVNIGDYDQYFLWWKTADRDNRIGSFQQGVYISGGSHNDVVNNNISNVHYGVTLSGTTNADVTDNTLTGNSVTGVTVGAGSHYATVNDNSISHFETAISVDGSNFVNVDNNNIFNVDNGIYANNTYGLNVEDNDITGGHCGWGDGTGISINNSSNVRIGGLFDGNDVDSFYDGIRVSNSEGVRVSFNDVWNMRHDGIQAFGGNDVNISWNHVTDVGNDGIYVGGMSEWNYEGEGYDLVPNTVISHNVVDWVGGDGIEVNNVTYSRINHNAVGLDGNASEDGYYEYDDGVSIGQNGIVVSTEYNDDPTEIDGNLVANTGWNGIAVYGVEDVSVTDNTVWNTHDNGIVVENADWVDISGNYVGIARPLFGPFSIGGGFIGGDGIRVGNYWYGNYGSVWITDNHVGNTGDDGIDVYGVSEARILGNNVNMTGDDGIVAANIGNGFMMPTIMLSEESEGEGSEEGPYYSLIIADNTVTDAGQRNQNDDECGDCMPELQIFEGEGENYGGDGIDVSGTSSALIESNEVDNSYDDGIVVSGFGDKRRGKREFYFEGPSEFGPTTSVVIRDNDVTNSGSDGIEVSNIDDAIVDVNRILNSGVNGFHAGGLRNGTVVLTGNTFTDNPVGALFESGLIDLTGEANNFNGGEVGLRFDPKNEEVYVGDRWVPYDDYDYEEYSFYEGGYWEPIFETVTADLNLVGDTIGTTVFNGQSQYYVELLDGALFAPGTPTIINGLDATYDGFRPSTVGGILTPDQYDALEAKIYHYNDLASLGLFFFGVVPGINDKDVYRAIDGFRPDNGSLNLTITGLPIVPGFGGSMANFLNGIAPAAGGNNPPKPQQFSSLVEQLASIAPAAGGDGNAGTDAPDTSAPSVGNSACWGDALAAAGAGTIVNMSYDGSPDTALNAAASCQSGI